VGPGRYKFDDGRSLCATRRHANANDCGAKGRAIEQAMGFQIVDAQGIDA